MRARVEWAEVVLATEPVLERGWAEMLAGHGAQRLAEVAKQVEGLHYQAAAQAGSRLGLALEKHAARRRFVAELKQRMSTI